MASPDPVGLDLFLRNWQLTEGYTLVCLFAALEEDLDTARTRIQAEAHELVRFSVSTMGLTRFQEFIRNHQGVNRSIVWFQQPDFDPAGWREILPLLNQHRDSIGRKGSVFLVLAGPPSLENLLRLHAGDLYDVADHRELTSPKPAREPSDPQLESRYRRALLMHYKASGPAAPMYELKLREDPKETNLNNERYLPFHLDFMLGGGIFRCQIDGSYSEHFPKDFLTILLKPLLPFYVPLDLYIHDHLNEGLVGFLEVQAKALNDIQLSATWLRERLKTQGAVLILDGLRLRIPEDLALMRHQITTFARVWPRINMLLFLKQGQGDWEELADLRRLFLIEPVQAPKYPGLVMPVGLPAKAVMPFLSNPNFVGREEDLLGIHRYLNDHDDHGILIRGLGGIGKTQLAVQYAWQYGYLYSGVFWVSMTDPSLIPREFSRCGEAMGVYERNSNLDLGTNVSLVKAYLQGTSEKLLLIFDNCDESSLLDQWIPQNPNVKVLITSRSITWKNMPLLNLDVLPRDASVKLLQQLSPSLDQNQAAEIAIRLGDFPLALQLAGRFLHTYHVSPAEYLEQLKRDELSHPSLKGWLIKNLPTSHQANVGRSLALSFNGLGNVKGEEVQAREIMTRACFFVPGEPIDQQQLRASLLHDDFFDEALIRLTHLGILKNEQGALIMHRLVSEYIRSTLTDAETKVILDNVNIAKDSHGHSPRD